MLKSSLLEALRRLIVSVHRDAVVSVNPGILRSRAYKRDRSFLATASELELLQELPVVGKSLDRALCLGQESTFRPSDDASLPPIPESRFSYFLDGVRGGDAACIKAFRQVTLLFAKLELNSPAPDEAIEAFVRRQAELPESVSKTPVVIGARDLVSRILSTLYWEDVIPRHGPGAVATGEKPWQKFHFKRIYADMQDFYPADAYFFTNMNHLSDFLRDPSEGLDFEELPCSYCKLVAVPKDFRGRRIIAMEPLEKQWVQQGQRRALVRRLEQHPLTRGYVNFSSQDVNRGLALSSSISGQYATLDLKDASDRVSLALCSALIEEPAISYLRASRSVGVELPSGQRITLRSFSPMGSAVCFPLESLVFYALAMSAVRMALKPTNLFPTRKDWNGILGKVYVYGDDLIVERQFAELVIQALTDVGLVVNTDKCCYRGPFRESCGLDAYNGVDVRPVRIKHMPDRSIPSSFPSSCSYLNEFRTRGMVNSYDTLMQEVANEFSTVPYLTCHSDPCGITTTSITEAVVWNNSHFASRWNNRLQRTEWRVTQVNPRFYHSRLPGWSQLLRNFTENPLGIPCDWSRDVDEWSVPHALTRNQRWMSL